MNGSNPTVNSLNNSNSLTVNLIPPMDSFLIALNTHQITSPKTLRIQCHIEAMKRNHEVVRKPPSE